VSDPARCRICRRKGAEVWHDGEAYCANSLECNFRARRRLGMSVARCLEAKAQDLERMATGARFRGERISELPPPSRNAEYQAHFASATWKAFRQDTLIAARWTCECGDSGPDVEVHHLTYERLGKEKPEDIIVLCPPCHRERHETAATA
jgi:5-methylcytosine-specific restriction endonuclease McrA